MNYEEFKEAIDDAELIIRRANRAANITGKLLIGRLRYCDVWVAEALKRELRDYNMATGKWKD